MRNARTITTSSNPASSASPAGWRAQSGAEVKVFVDTAPLMEKPLGEAAGLGWQGKHTNLVSREFGSWLFLGAILTHRRARAGCGRGRPLRQLPALPRRLPDRRVPRALSARRAPLHRLPDHRAQGPHPRGVPRGDRQSRVRLRRLPGRVPVEQVRRGRARDRLQALDGADSPPLAELLALDDAAFRERFAGTPVKRTGRDRVVRNALIAAGNSGDRGPDPAVERLLDDASPLVRAMAVWALQQPGRARGVVGGPAPHARARRMAPCEPSGPRRPADAALLLRLRLFGRSLVAPPEPRATSRSPAPGPACRSAAAAGPGARGVPGERRPPRCSALLARHHAPARQHPARSRGRRRCCGTTATTWPRCRDLAWIGYLSTVGVYGDWHRRVGR